MASTLDAATMLRDFNAIIYNNAQTNADIEGAAVVGGNFRGATMYQIPPSNLPAGFGALTVYGSTNGNNINMENGGNAYVAGVHGQRINFNGGGSYIGAPSVTMSTFETAMNGLSTSLSQLTATQTLTINDWNNVAINAVAGLNGIAVLDITAKQLSEIKGFSVDLKNATGLIINVSGKSVVDNANDLSGIAGADKIIWNFYEADNVSINRLIAGTVLAPLAHVTNNNQIDGTLVAKSWNGGGELHNYGYAGALPSEVPEPVGLALLGSGLGFVAFTRRRRERRAH